MPTRRHHPARAVLLALVVALLGPEDAAGQRAIDGIRLGLTFGGTGFVGASFEFFSDNRAIDLTIGTWGFSDVSLSVVAKELLGASSLRPSVGVGLWAVWSSPDVDDPDATRPGLTLLARAPVGFDWRVDGNHYLDGHVNVSSALWIRRTIPGDDRPPNRRLVPLPGLAYRWDPSS
jgi:hypothetical protein